MVGHMKENWRQGYSGVPTATLRVRGGEILPMLLPKETIKMKKS
jgi:hypothetical protein